MDWSEFNKFSDIMDPYLPDMGEGETKATQVATAVSKLVYKWFNDGDVYDNTYMLEGWANDLSSYANWLHKYIPETAPILDGIENCMGDADYEQLLYDLCQTCADPEYLAKLNQESTVGSVYDCNGPFEFSEYSDEDDDYDEDDYDDEWEEDDEESYEDDDF